jgi:hypothetical protein
LGEQDFALILSLSQQKSLLFIGRQIHLHMSPERLDLLAMDERGVPWVFEFKRDIAQTWAVGQLLNYGAYVAGLDQAELSAIYRNYHGGGGTADLKTAFKAKFDIDLPATKHVVCMVLAAYDFAYSCDHLLKFLQYAYPAGSSSNPGEPITRDDSDVRLKKFGIKIGRLKMAWQINADNNIEKIYRYLEKPSPTCAPPHALTESGTKTNHMASLPLKKSLWDIYRKKGILLMPTGLIWSNRPANQYTFMIQGSDDDDYLEAEALRLSALERYTDLKPDDGLFVYANDFRWLDPDHMAERISPEEVFDEDEANLGFTDPEPVKLEVDPDLVKNRPEIPESRYLYDHIASDELAIYSKIGLVGFCVVQTKPVLLEGADLDLFCRTHRWSRNAIRKHFDGPPCMIQVEWAATVLGENALPLMEKINANIPLQILENQDCILRCWEALGVDESFKKSLLDMPSF